MCLENPVDEQPAAAPLEDARRNARFTYAVRRIRKIVDGEPSLTAEQRSRLALILVDQKVAAAVAAAPPLPDDLAARLQQLISTVSAAGSEAELAA